MLNEFVMARLFSIDIPFRNAHYTALVSVKERGHDIHCIVRYIDKGIKPLLQGEKLVFSLHEGLKEPRQLPDDLARNFVACTMEAITGYFNHRA